MNKPPAFQFYVKDWLSDPKVMRMTPAQRGVYIHLLAIDWNEEGLEDNDEAIAGICGDNEGWLKGGYSIVKGCFNQHPSKPGFITNGRLQQEREKQRAWREKSSEGGKKSGLVRSEQATYKKSKGRLTTLQAARLNGGSTLQSSSASSFANNPPLSPKGECFVIFYKAYPKKKAKGAALRAWNKIPNACELLPEMLSAIEQQKKSPGWLKDNGQFIPHPATWLHDQGWLDEIDIFSNAPKKLPYAQ
jgi:uncharacterized protein YdaU (DUF1376 family)